MGGSSILVVEDEEQVRRFISTTLTRAGYRVVEAANAVEAISLLLSSPEEIPLAVVDIVMPGTGGLDFANQAAMDRPDTDILYISGFTDSVVVDSINRRRPEAMLRKPFTASQLLTRVREMLNR
jgi:two-component system cell cycle sensor histidine kinase/response regulator CckA